MTLVASGAISLSAVNTELGRTSTAALSMSDAQLRSLAGDTSGAIAMSSLYSKNWYLQSELVPWISTNRAACTKWVGGGTGDVRYWNNPYSRYTASSTFSTTFANSAWPASTWTTVIICLTGYSPNISAWSINGVASAGTRTIVRNITDQEIHIVHYNADVRTITDASVTWTHSNGNAGSWAAIFVIPGKWATYTNGTLANTATVDLSVPAYSVGFYTGYTPGYNGGWNTISSVTSGITYESLDAYWYNNGSIGMLVNPTSAAKTATLRNPTDSYGAVTPLTYQYIMLTGGITM